MKTSPKKPFLTVAAIAGCGFCSGMLNALIGTGGGIIITFLLSNLYAESDMYSTKDIFSMTLASVALMTVGTVVMYLQRGIVKLSDASPFIIPAAIGGAIGAAILDKANAAFMKKIFALLIIWAGVSSFFK